ncbi:SynChlorMet cassette protein ScmC [bacterium]|nr:SynChlorMet cassette protein ScmC [bacterium]
MPDYSLHLADGFRWRYSSTPDRSGWLEQFADTLTLPSEASVSASASHASHIHICSPAETDQQLASLWGDARPVSFELGPLQVYTLRGATDRLFVTPDSGDRHQWLMSMWYSLYPLYPALLKQGHLPVHGGLAEWNGRGVLFAAPGGTGKSTTLSRLPESWRTICDDETWLVPTDAGLRAHPLPTWSDLVLRKKNGRWPSTTSLPLQHVVFLRQAEHVSVRRLDHAETAALLNQSVEQILRRAWAVLVPPDLAAVKARMFELAEARARSLSGILLDLNLHDPFADKLQDFILAANA